VDKYDNDLLYTTHDDVVKKDRKTDTVIRDFDINGGINLMKEFLSDNEKEALKIQNWNMITFAKELRDNSGKVIEVKFRNKYAPFGQKSRRYRAIDDEPFVIAKKFIADVRRRIQYTDK
jgi:hypothetical protein